jgi:DNA polymerase
MSPDEERQALDEQIKACRLCELAKTRTNAVPGDGPLGAKILFVGEAPGFNEDRQGRPFVGQAGRLLSELLRDIGLSRDEVFITNIVKCRPPENRDPGTKEIGACEPYLDRQLTLLDPYVVVTLGRFSMAKFFPGQMISRIHGQPRRDDQRIYYPLYHPAAVLRSEGLRPTMEADFRKIPELLAEASQMRTRSAAPDTTQPPPQQTSMFS